LEDVGYKEYFMKKELLKSLVALSLVIPVFGACAATYNVGTFYVSPGNPDGDYAIDTTGVFWDEFDFYTRVYGGSYRDSTSMTFSGSHSGMFNDELMLVNLNTRQTYSLDEDFSITIDDLRYNQRFAITGAGVNAIDPTVISSYTLSMDAVLDPYTFPPNPVPLPAAAWLFASGLMGFLTYRRKRGTA
jgi:hypothetical protein